MSTRALTAGDAAALAALHTANRDFLAPYDPVRPAEWFTEAGQAEVVAGLLARAEAGTVLPRVILDPDGAVAGRITLTGIEHGPYRNARVGYWVARDANGRGLATAAVAEVLGLAFGALGLHRVEASTLVDNLRSQAVLTRNGFTRIGLAPRYLHIAGEWRDHLLFQRLADDRDARPAVRSGDSATVGGGG
ncbi:MAG: GNAT family N-acetyltransferase [Amnibacterium sp.]